MPLMIRPFVTPLERRAVTALLKQEGMTPERFVNRMLLRFVSQPRLLFDVWRACPGWFVSAGGPWRPGMLDMVEWRLTASTGRGIPEKTMGVMRARMGEDWWLTVFEHVRHYGFTTVAACMLAGLSEREIDTLVESILFSFLMKDGALDAMVRGEAPPEWLDDRDAWPTPAERARALDARLDEIGRVFPLRSPGRPAKVRGVWGHGLDPGATDALPGASRPNRETPAPCNGRRRQDEEDKRAYWSPGRREAFAETMRGKRLDRRAREWGADVAASPMALTSDQWRAVPALPDPRRMPVGSWFAVQPVMSGWVLARADRRWLRLPVAYVVRRGDGVVCTLEADRTGGWEVGGLSRKDWDRMAEGAVRSLLVRTLRGCYRDIPWSPTRNGHAEDVKFRLIGRVRYMKDDPRCMGRGERTRVTIGSRDLMMLREATNDWTFYMQRPGAADGAKFCLDQDTPDEDVRDAVRRAALACLEDVMLPMEHAMLDASGEPARIVW